MMKTYKGYIGSLDPKQIFVFGSNPEGRHGSGTAKIAMDIYGAKRGQGRGLMGQSYGLITKNLTEYYLEVETDIEYIEAGFKSVSQTMIIDNIFELYEFANNNPDKEFFIAYTPYGRLLNGYSIQEMAEMFTHHLIPENIIFNEDFVKLF